ncbi:hypothetical protein Bca101_029017 [Brassica carinata]
MEVERDQTVSSPTIPIVDLSNLDKELVARAVVKASHEWGGFQVVNHEIPKELIQSLKKVGTHFFELSSEAEKEAVATPANSKDIQGYVTNSQQDIEDKVNEEYARQVKKLAEKILGWLSEGLGLDREALFNQGFGGGEKAVYTMKINYYPPCRPQANLVLGMQPHTDIHGLTLLVPNEIPGLQAIRSGMTRSVSRRGEELLKAQRSSLSLASVSPTPRSLPPVRTRRSNVSESACVSVTKSPPVLPSKPEPPDLFPVEQIKPLFETFPPPDPLPPDPPFKTPSPPEPPDPPLEAPSPMCPPEPPDPPDVLALNAPLRFCDTSSRPSLQALFQISTVKLPCRIATKSAGGGGAHVFASDTLLAYGLLSPVVYRSIFGCVDWSLFSSCFDLPITPPCKVSHVHLSSFFSTYFATVEWIRQLFVWVTLELRFMTLVGDIPMVLVLFGPTLATSNSIFIALARSSAVCSSLTSSIPGVGVMFVYLSSWWQVEEKLIFIFSLMNMDVAGYDFSLVPRLNQSSFLILPPIWSELEEQASLVLQGSSSHRMLFSAYGAVCVRMSNGKYKNVLHRTTLNTEKTRMSWVVLLKPPYDMVIEPLTKHTGDGDEAPKFKPITYGEHVERKVRDKLQKRS